MATRRRTGTIERGVMADLGSVRPDLRAGGQAQAALAIARHLDDPILDVKNVPGLARELRALLEVIFAASPREEAEDGIDQIKDQLAARRAKKSSPG